jgi:death on curing protein
LARQAAVLLYHVAKAHACIDGNKRIAAMLMFVFLELNGYAPYFPEGEVSTFTRFAADGDPAQRHAVVDDLTEWIANRIRRADPPLTGAVH